MDNVELRRFREALGATQATMAKAMGMPLRSYQDIEAGKNPVRPVHEAAAKRAAAEAIARMIFVICVFLGHIGPDACR